MFTKDTEYAVLVVKELKSVDNKEPLSLQKIVSKYSLKQGFAEQVCRRLRSNGFISSIKGPGGGYLITESGSNASLWDLMWAVEARLKNKVEKLLPESREVFYKCEDKLKEVYIRKEPVRSVED